MNFDAIWQTHRKFIMAIAGGLVLFLIAQAIIGSTARSSLRSSEHRIRTGRAALRKPAFDSAAESRVRNRLEEMQSEAAEIAGETLPPWRAAFQPQQGESPSKFYIERTGSLRQDLIPWVHRADVDIDESLGMPAVSPTEPQKIERVLRGLDVIDRVVRLAVAGGAREIDDIEIALRAAGRRRVGGQVPALDLTPVSLSLVLPEGKSFPLLLELVQADPPLGLMQIELGSVDPRRPLRRLNLEFAVGGLPPAEEDAL